MGIRRDLSHRQSAPVPEQIVWIVNHAGGSRDDVDLTFVPLLEKLRDKLPNIERYVILTDAAQCAADPS